MELVSLALVWTVAWWAIAWMHLPFLSGHSFFPLWIGFIVTTNALSEVCFGGSLIRRMGWRFLWLFLISIPMWWFFEFLNSFVHNWHYLYLPVSRLRYTVEFSRDFSTVVPAVLSATFLTREWLRSKRGEWLWRRIPVTKAGLALCILLGLLGFWALYTYPLYTFPLVWVAPLLILDPIAYMLGLPSILRYLGENRWLLPLSAALATLGTGFFWEMWNFYSFPKWYYTVPWVGFFKVFEMPLLGYGGYLPFGLLVWTYSLLALKLIGVPSEGFEPPNPG